MEKPADTRYPVHDLLRRRWTPRVFADRTVEFDYNQKENRHALHDVGLAVANLTVQATALDLYVHQMGGVRRDKARELFDIPEDHEPVTALAVGYLAADAETLPDDLRQRELAPRPRKPLEAFVFAGRWGRIWPLIDDQT